MKIGNSSGPKTVHCGRTSIMSDVKTVQKGLLDFNGMKLWVLFLLCIL